MTDEPEIERCVCEDCTELAVTHDGRFCRACLKKRLRAEDPLYAEADKKGFKYATRARLGVRDGRTPRVENGAPREMTEDDQ